MAALLRQAAAHGIEPDYVQKLLNAFLGRVDADKVPANGVGQPPGKNEASSALVEPLTPRELEVLELICAGNSNQAIADQLVIAVKTVKKHTGNILGKLGVTSRAQAMVKAHQLGLLPKDN